MTTLHRFPWFSALVLTACLLGCSTVPEASGGGPKPTLPPLQNITLTLGQGSPIVVLQSGLGDGLDAWQQLTPLLQKDFTVFGYDRPGRNRHPAANTPRDPCTIAAEQHALLQRAGLQPPYILVGHSMGGLYQFAYARLYPDEVAGLVLLDPTHPRHWETLQGEHPRLAIILNALRATVFSATDRAEFDAQTTCLDRLPSAGARRVPARLLVSGVRRPEESAMSGMLDNLRLDWEVLLGNVAQQRIGDAGHYLQKDRPDLVAQAIRSLAREAAAARVPSR